MKAGSGDLCVELFASALQKARKELSAPRGWIEIRDKNTGLYAWACGDTPTDAGTVKEFPRHRESTIRVALEWESPPGGEALDAADAIALALEEKLKAGQAARVAATAEDMMLLATHVPKIGEFLGKVAKILLKHVPCSFAGVFLKDLRGDTVSLAAAYKRTSPDDPTPMDLLESAQDREGNACWAYYPLLKQDGNDRLLGDISLWTQERPERGLTGWVVETGNAIRLRHAGEKKPFDDEIDLYRKALRKARKDATLEPSRGRVHFGDAVDYQGNPLMIVPIRDGNDVVGALRLRGKPTEGNVERLEQFTDCDQAVAEYVAEQMCPMAHHMVEDAVERITMRLRAEEDDVGIPTYPRRLDKPYLERVFKKLWEELDACASSIRILDETGAQAQGRYEQKWKELKDHLNGPVGRHEKPHFYFLHLQHDPGRAVLGEREPAEIPFREPCLAHAAAELGDVLVCNGVNEPKHQNVYEATFENVQCCVIAPFRIPVDRETKYSLQAVLSIDSERVNHFGRFHQECVKEITRHLSHELGRLAESLKTGPLNELHRDMIKAQGYDARMRALCVAATWLTAAYPDTLSKIDPDVPEGMSAHIRTFLAMRTDTHVGVLRMDANAGYALRAQEERDEAGRVIRKGIGDQEGRLRYADRIWKHRPLRKPKGKLSVSKIVDESTRWVFANRHSEKEREANIDRTILNWAWVDPEKIPSAYETIKGRASAKEPRQENEISGSILAVPILAQDGLPLGVLTLNSLDDGWLNPLWIPTAAALAKEAALIIMQERGFGYSPNDNLEVTIRANSAKAGLPPEQRRVLERLLASIYRDSTLYKKVDLKCLPGYGIGRTYVVEHDIRYGKAGRRAGRDIVRFLPRANAEAEMRNYERVRARMRRTDMSVLIAHDLSEDWGLLAYTLVGPETESCPTLGEQLLKWELLGADAACQLIDDLFTSLLVRLHEDGPGSYIEERDWPNVFQLYERDFPGPVDSKIREALADDPICTRLVGILEGPASDPFRDALRECIGDAQPDFQDMLRQLLSYPDRAARSMLAELVGQGVKGDLAELIDRSGERLFSERSLRESDHHRTIPAVHSMIDWYLNWREDCAGREYDKLGDELAPLFNPRLSLCHGDLTLHNVVVPYRSFRCYLIDFDKVHRGHLLEDYARLETYVIADVFRALSNAAEVRRVYEFLHRNDDRFNGLTDEATPRQENFEHWVGKLSKPSAYCLRLIRKIRELAYRSYRQQEQPMEAYVTEYKAALLFQCLDWATFENVDGRKIELLAELSKGFRQGLPR